MVHASLFSGIGGFDLAAEWMGWENVFHCEINEWCAKVLKYHFPNSKHYADITKTDFSKWRGKIDILTGGFPCQPFSLAGQRKGKDDDRYLWPEMLRAIREIRPTWVIGENVAGIITMVQPGEEIEVEHQSSLFETHNKETVHEQEFVIETICRDLESEGYSVQPVLIPACAVGAPHQRHRCFIIAHSDRNDAGRRRFKKVGQKTGKVQSEQEEQKRIWSDLERTGEKGITTYSRSKQLQERTQESISENRTENKSRFDYWIERFGNFGIITNTYKLNGNNGRFCTSEISQFETSGIFQMPGWKEFPTQSPVLSGDDGVSNLLDGITFSKWRSESVKGYGNAIVPQVMYEIFKAISEVEKSFTSRK